MNYSIAIGADHRGFALKTALTQSPHIGAHIITWTDIGTFNTKRTDYPQYALQVTTLVRQNEVELGILLCGSGIGVAIAANRFKGTLSERQCPSSSSGLFGKCRYGLICLVPSIPNVRLP